jgi:hypothetical protein
MSAFEHERRFVLSKGQAEEFLAVVSTRTAQNVYDELRPIAYTRTTYLDTDDLAYHRSSTGPVARRLRIREYAGARALGEPPVLTGICFLEHKETAGLLRTKARFAAPPEVVAQMVDRQGEIDGAWQGWLAQIQAFQVIQQELREGRLAPRLTTWYRRVSLTGEAGRVRITLDEGIAFCRPTTIGRAGDPAAPTEVVERFPNQLVEIKYHGDAPGWLTQATGGLAEAARFSKFQVGMTALTDAPATSQPAARWLQVGTAGGK